MSALTGKEKVGDIARIWPETMKVFARYQLDLCCGGVHPLNVVAAKHQLDLEKLVQELDEAIAAQSAVK